LETISDEAVTNQSQYFVASRASCGGGQGDHTNEANTVAYCIRANSRGRIQFHYALERRLTVRECARLQSFPDQFVFPFTTQRNLTLIGNAVPPILGYRVAVSVENFMRSCSDVAVSTYANLHVTVRSGVQMTRSHALQPELF
jgi:DNA (cytosine-5)-methyltransferase 1